MAYLAQRSPRARSARRCVDGRGVLAVTLAPDRAAILAAARHATAAVLHPPAVIDGFTTALGELRFNSTPLGGASVSEHQRTPGLRAFREAGDG